MLFKYFLSPAKADLLPTDGGWVVRPFRPPWLRACTKASRASERELIMGVLSILHNFSHQFIRLRLVRRIKIDKFCLTYLQEIDCYLLDNNGYVVLSETPSEVIDTDFIIVL